MDNGANSYRRFLNGDDSGIVEIIKEYKDGLMLYLNSYVNNIFAAEDLMEETFFRLVTKKPKFSMKSSFKTWLYTIGRNTAVDFIRKNSRFSYSPIEEYESLIEAEDDLEKAYIQEEQKIILHKAINRLNPEYRQILWLIFFEEFSNNEAAVIMKKNKRQIENLIYRAKKALKSVLEREGVVYEEL